MYDPAAVAPLRHGGDLEEARRLFPRAEQPFVDLSTGINPHAYPIPLLSPSIFQRLPTAVERLSTIAAAAYGAPSAAHVVPAPGTQILLRLVATLVPPRRAAVLGPTYGEHIRSAAQAGHEVREIDTLDNLNGAELVTVVNPNNPDGLLMSRDALLALANDLRPRGGMLVADEAFMDVGPLGASLAGDVACGNIVVLRSFGKFFGLAGLRLGFAIAAPPIARQLTASLGPWAVSGPAIAVGEAALADTTWGDSMRGQLAEEAKKLDQHLTCADLQVVGGTSLFRLVRTPLATEWFGHLGRAGIFVRRFVEQSSWLRFGLPAGEDEWNRLHAALASFGLGVARPNNE